MAKTRRKQRSRVGRRSKRSRRSRVARRSKVGRRSRVGRRSKRTSRLNRSRRNIIKRRSTMKGGAAPVKPQTVDRMLEILAAAAAKPATAPRFESLRLQEMRGIRKEKDWWDSREADWRAAAYPDKGPAGQTLTNEDFVLNRLFNQYGLGE